jgi:hypothetical protein
MVANFIALLVFSVIFTEACTELLVKSKIFEPLRESLSQRSKFIKEMLSCGYCASVWVAIFPALVISASQPWYWGLAAFVFFVPVIHRLSNYLHNINDRWFDKFYINKKPEQ